MHDLKRPLCCRNVSGHTVHSQDTDDPWVGCATVMIPRSCPTSLYLGRNSLTDKGVQTQKDFGITLLFHRVQFFHCTGLCIRHSNSVTVGCFRHANSRVPYAREHYSSFRLATPVLANNERNWTAFSRQTCALRRGFWLWKVVPTADGQRPINLISRYQRTNAGY